MIYLNNDNLNDENLLFFLNNIFPANEKNCQKDIFSLGQLLKEIFKER